MSVLRFRLQPSTLGLMAAGLAGCILPYFESGEDESSGNGGGAALTTSPAGTGGNATTSASSGQGGTAVSTSTGEGGEGGAVLGTQSNPAASCAAVLESGASKGDGTYWLGESAEAAHLALCEMSTEGGGWTVLWRIGLPSTKEESDRPEDQAFNARWGYDGQASTQLVDDLGASGDWSQPADWSTSFGEWMVGSPSQGYRRWQSLTSFNTSGINGSCTQVSPMPTQCLAPSTPESCLTVPGISFPPDAAYIGFDVGRVNSSSRCRFTYGYDDDVSYNDTQHGLMCRYWDGKPRGQLRMMPSSGYALMAR